MRKRYWVLGGVAALLTAVLLLSVFWQSLISSYILYTLEQGATSMKGEFSSSGIRKENTDWVVVNPTFSTSSLTVRADALKVSLFSEPWKRILTVNLHVEKPIADIYELKEDWNQWVDFEPKVLGFLKIKGKASVVDGQLAVHKNPEKVERIYFNIEAEHQQKSQGLCTLTFDPCSTGKKEVTFLFSQGYRHGSEYTLHFQDLDCFKSVFIFGQFFPYFKNVSVSNGTLNGNIKIKEASKKSSLPISVEGDLLLENFSFFDPFFSVQGKIDKGTLHLDPSGFGNGNVLGSAEVTGAGLFPVGIENVQGELNFTPENLPTLFLKANILGMSALVQMDWQSSEKFVQASLEGSAYYLADLLSKVHPEFKNQFGQDRIRFSGVVQSSSEGYMINGNITDHEDYVDFHLRPVELANTFQEWVGKGAFKTSLLPLKKFVDPFLFENRILDLAGNVIVEGDWNGSILKLKYETHDLLLENKDLAIRADSGKERGEHRIDLASFQHEGTLPVCCSAFLEKNTGLEFTDVNALVSFKGKKIEIPQIEAFCQGVYFGGKIELDFDQEIPIHIHAHTMNGKVSQVRNLLSFVDQRSFFSKFPIEGNLSFRKEGAHFQFGQNPRSFQAEVHAGLTDGIVASQYCDVSAQEISLHLDYDFQANTLNIFDVQGAVLVGKPHHVEEYLLAADRIRFTNYAQNEAEFDIWVGDKNRDIIRLAGKTKKAPNQRRARGLVEVLLDSEISHFGDVHPEAFQLILRNWSEINTFNLDFSFKLNTLLSDIQRFSRTGLLFLSRHFLKKLNELKNGHGNFSVALKLDPQRSVLNYLIKGQDIDIAEHHFDQVLLNGKKKDDVWTIDQFSFDRISFAAEVRRLAESWKIDFLGLSFGKSFLLGLEGEFFDLDKKFKGRINLLEAYLDDLDEWKWGKKLAQQFNLKGILKGSGDVVLEIEKDSPKWKVESTLNVSAKGVKAIGWGLEDIHRISCYYSTDKGLVLKDIQGCARLNEQEKTCSSINLKTLSYDFKTESLNIKEMRFAIPPSSLIWLSNYFKEAYPEFISSNLTDMIPSLKQHENLEGVVDMTFSKPFFDMHLALKDGVYIVNEDTHEIKNFSLDYDPYSADFTSEYRFKNSCYRLKGHSSSNPIFKEGECIIFKSDPPSADEKDPSLSIHWKNGRENRPYIHQVSGSLEGIACDLKEDPGIVHALMGDVHIRSSNAISFIYPELSKQLSEWNINNEFVLTGKWRFFKNNKAAEDPPFFQGKLRANPFVVNGYEFESLEAICFLSKQKIAFDQMTLKDQAGDFSVNELIFQQDKNALWSIHLANANLANFRPHLMRVSDVFLAVPKTLNIRQFDLNQVEGVLQNPLTIKGKGRLSFSNPSKDQIPNTLFAIPEEMLSKIGLNLALLTPVTGTIFFEIEKGKIVLKKFRDVFSEGKVSKFYLADTEDPPSLDFGGNLHVEIAMKQYNLLFKLAELFNVSITGNLARPIYSLQKHDRHDDKK